MKKLSITLLLPALLMAGCKLQSPARNESTRAMNEGIRQLQKGNFSGAERALQDAVQKDPMHALAHYNMGKLYVKQERWADAEQSIEQAVLTMGAEQNPDYFFQLGVVQAAQGGAAGVPAMERDTKYREAIESFNKTIAAKPTAYKAHFRVGELEEKLDNPAGADASYRACINTNGKYSKCFVALGNMYIDYGHANVAMSVLDVGAQINETDPEMWNGLGRAYQTLNKPQEAVDSFRKAKLIDPDRVDVLYGMGMAYADLRMQKECAEQLQAFLTRAGQEVPEDIRKAAQDTLQKCNDIVN